MARNEADTCKDYVLPKLHAAGWDADPHAIVEQYTFTDGRILLVEDKIYRNDGRRADYLLRYTRDMAIAVVEAKAEHRTPGTGLQQAKVYAEMLGLKFAYATNGRGIVEFDYITGLETERATFPTPDELWIRLGGMPPAGDEADTPLLFPFDLTSGKIPRYYQEIAINRVVEQIALGNKRVLVTMATGTGKTFVAYQICWKLWSSHWNREGKHRRPRILYVADRSILVDDPKDKDFLRFGDARERIGGGPTRLSRDIYFTTYQALANDEPLSARYRTYPPDFFDLVIVDECHRGSASDESNWREILQYFSSAFQLGMTATPKRNDNVDTYRYFGNPVYTYSLRQGIDDGFLAPYRVHRVVTSYDAEGWSPEPGERDAAGHVIPERLYQTSDFERIIAMPARTKAIARHLTHFMAGSDRMAKTIVFCPTQEHADEMRRELNNLNLDLVQQWPDYVARITSDEGEIGTIHLDNFKDPEVQTPVIATTSHLLSTGVDIPSCVNVVILRVINSITEFKQIIGRGTRLCPQVGKFFFNIIDYTNSATRLFADPEFDGFPAEITEVTLDGEGNEVPGSSHTEIPPENPRPEGGRPIVYLPPPGTGGPHEPRITYRTVGGHVDIVGHTVYELDPDGNQIRAMRYTDYTGEQVRTLYPTIDELGARWRNPEERSLVEELLAARGIRLEDLVAKTGRPDVDPFDMLCHLAYNVPLRSRRQRAAAARRRQAKLFEDYGADARAILEEILAKYAEHGTRELVFPEVLKLDPIARHGNVSEIARHFGGVDRMRDVFDTLQTELYS